MLGVCTAESDSRISAVGYTPQVVDRIVLLYKNR